VDGVAGFIAALSVCVFLTVNLPLLIGSRSFSDFDLRFSDPRL
jgi:hypothetical protein